LQLAEFSKPGLPGYLPLFIFYSIWLFNNLLILDQKMNWTNAGIVSCSNNQVSKKFKSNQPNEQWIDFAAVYLTWKIDWEGFFVFRLRGLA